MSARNQPQVVDRLSELDWLVDVVDSVEGDPQAEMATVLQEHQDAAADNGGRYCICGDWEGPWTGTAFAEHQASALVTALREVRA